MQPRVALLLAALAAACTTPGARQDPAPAPRPAGEDTASAAGTHAGGDSGNPDVVAARAGRDDRTESDAVAAAGTGAAATATAPAAGWRAYADTRISRDLALATFDSAWSRIRRTHYDPVYRGPKWDSVRLELRPRAASAKTVERLRAVINAMLARLESSHYALIPHEVAGSLDPDDATGGGGWAGDAGMSLRLVGGRVLVASVDSGGAAAAAGVAPGWIVKAIGGRRMDDVLAGVDVLAPRDQRRGLTQTLYAINGMLHGRAGSILDVRMLNASDEPTIERLVRRPSRGEPIRFGNLPVFLADLHYSRFTDDGGCVGVIRFNVWLPPLSRDFDRAIDALRDCRGIAVDLRGNPGGVAGMVMGVAGHFLDDAEPLGFMKSPAGEIRFVANPRRVDTAGRFVSPYAGRVAVIIDGMSASTSEFFAGGLQAVGRARVFGTTSAGQALPAAMVRLPDHDVLMYVVGDYTAPDGWRIEGRGVEPDVTIPLTREDLLAGRDAPLEAALAWLAGSVPTHDRMP